MEKYEAEYVLGKIEELQRSLHELQFVVEKFLKPNYQMTPPPPEREATKEKKINRSKKIPPQKWIPYEQYLKTAHWQQFRKKALQKAKYTCQLCNNKNEVLHVHHKDYGYLWNERYKDVIVLCKSCHEKVHGVV